MWSTFLSLTIFSISIFLQIGFISTCDNDTNISKCENDANLASCDDWTLCQRIDCAPPPEKCPKDKPYYLLSECGCCEFCSACPRKGPCGTCGVDVICKDRPICGENHIVTIDNCGCCRVCRDRLEEGQNCQTEYAVCDEGLQCINGICSKKLR